MKRNIFVGEVDVRHVLTHIIEDIRKLRAFLFKSALKSAIGQIKPSRDIIPALLSIRKKFGNQSSGLLGIRGYAKLLHALFGKPVMDGGQGIVSGEQRNRQLRLAELHRDAFGIEKNRTSE